MRQGSTGNIRVWLAADATSLTDPPLAAITAAVDLTPGMRRNGLDTPRGANTIDASDATSRQDKTAPGNISAGTVTYRGWLNSDSGSADMAIFDALAEDETGVLVVRRFGGSSVAPAAAQKVETYKVSVLTREVQPIGDDAQNYVVTFTIEDGDQDAAVAA